MLNEKMNWSSIDDIQLAPRIDSFRAPQPAKTNPRFPEDEPTVEMTRAEVEEMLHRALRASEQN